LVGSSLGATLVARAAEKNALVVALALISPGERLGGMDVYPAYAQVRNLRTFLAGGMQDAVAQQPLSVLSQMSQLGELKTYPGNLHSARYIGEKQPALWQDLENWLMAAFEEMPRERRSLYYAPGKEPKQGARPVAKQRAAHSTDRAGGAN
jgi:pimeloyl-ACP methyl ester carboxylesterase